MGKKAKLLGKANDTTCILCFLIKSQNPDVQFKLISEGTFYRPEDKYVCEHCLNWIHEIRDKCEKQCLDPKEDVFASVTFWHDPKREEKSAIEVKGSKVLQEV